MRSRLLLALLLFLAPGYSRAQPFPCDGRPIVAITPSREPSRLFHLDWPEAAQPVVFHRIGGQEPPVILNALGFRVTDGYLYGVHPVEHRLYRVGADGVAHSLGPLSLTPDYGYFAGDVSPDGRYLILLGSRGVPPATRSLAAVDLTAPGFPVRELPLMVEGLHGEVYCADIAFSPVDGRLWGYDGRHRQLVHLDPGTARLSPAAGTLSSNPTSIGALVFDAFGRLFGYGGEGGLRTLFHVDKGEGAVRPLQTGPAATGADGCSCPYTVDLQQRVAPAAAPACSDLRITLLIANRSGAVQQGLTLRDTLPDGFAWREVLRNPFPGKVRLEMDRRVLLIEDLEAPPGLDSLTLLAAGHARATGRFTVQATLERLPAHLGGRRRSGNPATAAFQDATPFTLLPADTQSIAHRLELCPGESFTLAPSVNGTAYRWSDGSEVDHRTVSGAGHHRLTVTYGCQQWIEDFQVQVADFGLDLGPDLQLDLGDRRQLFPILTGDLPQSAHWSSSPEGGLSCLTCLNPEIAPTATGTYRLTVTSAGGCTATDELRVEVIRHRKLFAPNAFSPNNDGSNDFFFLQSKHPVRLRTFQIIDRWGNLLCERRDIYSNDPAQGWDGRSQKGATAPAGAYLYRALALFPDGVEKMLTGEVLLLR